MSIPLRAPRFAAHGLAALVAALLIAPIAGAAPLTFFFLGSDGFGVDLTQAEAAETAGEIEIRDYAQIFPTEDDIGVLLQPTQIFDESNFDPFPPDEPDGIPPDGPNTAFSDWFITNVSGLDLGPVVLTFETSEDIAGLPKQYTDANVGLTIDRDDGWFLARTVDPLLGTVIFPARSLGDLGIGGVSQTFRVNYVLNEPGQQIGNAYYTPKLGLGFAAVPEPGTGALVGVGFALLAAGRRRRHGGRARG